MSHYYWVLIQNCPIVFIRCCGSFFLHTRYGFHVIFDSNVLVYKIQNIQFLLNLFEIFHISFRRNVLFQIWFRLESQSFGLVLNIPKNKNPIQFCFFRQIDFCETYTFYTFLLKYIVIDKVWNFYNLTYQITLWFTYQKINLFKSMRV